MPLREEVAAKLNEAEEQALLDAGIAATRADAPKPPSSSRMWTGPS
jgi:hypothetical protein